MKTEQPAIILSWGNLVGRGLTSPAHVQWKAVYDKCDRVARRQVKDKWNFGKCQGKKEFPDVHANYLLIQGHQLFLFFPIRN